MLLLLDGSGELISPGFFLGSLYALFVESPLLGLFLGNGTAFLDAALFSEPLLTKPLLLGSLAFILYASLLFDLGSAFPLELALLVSFALGRLFILQTQLARAQHESTVTCPTCSFLRAAASSALTRAVAAGPALGPVGCALPALVLPAVGGGVGSSERSG